MGKKQRDPLPPIVPRRFLTFPTAEEIQDGDGEGFIQVPKSYVQFPANALKVWLWLHERYGATERHAWESYPNMAAALGISSRTIQRMVQWLVRERVVICVQQKKRGAGHTNCLIALTKQPSVDEFNDLTARLQDAWWKKQDKKSSLSKTKVPEKQDILSAEASQIVQRITPKRQTSNYQHPAKTGEAVEAVDSAESSDQKRVANEGTLSVLNNHSLAAPIGVIAGDEGAGPPAPEVPSSTVTRDSFPATHEEQRARALEVLKAEAALNDR